jgi:MFS family permease
MNMMNSAERIRPDAGGLRGVFLTLSFMVILSGACQGMTLPLLSVLMEKSGFSSVDNGLNTTALYIGILIASPLVEFPLRRFGYRTTIVLGLLMMTAATLLLPMVASVWIWFLLRFLLGIGDTMLHVSSQTWVTTLAPDDRRGRWLTIYGFAYGAGFCAGPLGMLLLPFGTWVPFYVLGLFYAVALVLLMRLKTAYPPEPEKKKGQSRYGTAIRLGWYALLPCLLYGFLESSMNVNFPVYAMRSGVPVEWVAVCLPAFTIGTLVLQIPLGMWSDRVGRKKVLMICAGIGGAAFALVPLFGVQVGLLMAGLVVAGATVGSFYSLGLAYSSDLLPAALLPTIGVTTGMAYSVGSLVAPSLNGVLIESVAPGAMFVVLGVLLALFALVGFFVREKRKGA